MTDAWHRLATQIATCTVCPELTRSRTRVVVGEYPAWPDRPALAFRPLLVVALGLTAAAWFLGRGITLAAVRGRVHDVTIGGVPLRVLPTYHPSAAIRFGPTGAPMAALRDDLALAAKLVAVA